MLNNAGLNATKSVLVVSQSATTTALASSSTTYVDVRNYEGELEFQFNPGAITGSLTPDIQDATDAAGTGTASVAALEGAYTALVANTGRNYTIPAKATRGFIRVINTLVTGPALIGVTLIARQKTV